ncbi:MAG: ABC transporter substrate-binding protein [Acidimicrobiia bacterium]|nr:ABC transporter substrate-binding protein [Acidimicrobiia bacterium]
MALLGLSLVAAACGSDDGGDQASSVTVDQDVNSAVNNGSDSAESTTSTTAAAEPQSMEEWEELWAAERAAIVAEIEENGWGTSADGTTATGPAGFTIDLTACPAGWSNTEGLTDTSVKIGQAIAQSGTFADYNNYARGIQAVFEYYGDQGAFTDSLGKTRTIDYIARDDGYDPARTIPLVDELLDSERAFAIWTLGSPSTLKVYDKLNQRCVPHPTPMTAHPAWGDPVNHPWTTAPAATSYSTEAILWGNFIEERIDEFGDEVTVAALVMNNDFGKVYDQTFRAYLEQSDLLRDRVTFVAETIEAQAPTVKDPMTTLAAEQPDVFIAMLAATPCTQVITEAAENGMKETTPYLFQPLTCAGLNFISKEKLGGDGMAGDGWWILNPGTKDLQDEAQHDDPFVEWSRELLESKGIDPDSSSLLGNGVGTFGWTAAQALMIAGELDGGLNRSNFIVAQRSMEMTNPYMLPGIRLHMEGNDDAYFVEGGVFQQFDAAVQTWVTKSEPIELDGKSQNCNFDPAAGACIPY